MRRPRVAAAALVSGVLLIQGNSLDAGADDAGAGAGRRATAVAVIGAGPTARTIAVGDLEDGLAAMPGFQRATFGGTADAIRRRFLDEVLVRDRLLSLGAQAARLDAQPAVARALDRAASGATVRAIRTGLGPATAIPMADVRAYYERNRERYDAPARYQLWRILCTTSDEARTVLAAAAADPTPKTFAQLARDHSQDKATALRSGNLGFLTADGTSSEPGLRVDPAIVHASLAVRDGELVPSPVVEGEFFSVVWRRGTSAARKRTVEEVAAPIREILWRERAKTEVDGLVASLRTAKVRDLHEELLDAVDLSVAPDASRAP
jgi:peptidyl-prolyl cis-trans isomerase C